MAKCLDFDREYIAPPLTVLPALSMPSSSGDKARLLCLDHLIRNEKGLGLRIMHTCIHNICLKISCTSM